MSVDKGFVLRLIVTVGLLAFLVTRLDFGRADLGPPAGVAAGVLASVVLLSLTQLLTALRWRAVLGHRSPSTWFLTRLTFVGVFFSTFLPTSVGGDAIRALGVADGIDDPGASVSSVLLDRALGFGALIVYLVVGMVVSPGTVQEVAGQLRWDLPLWGWGLLAVAVPVGAIAVRRTRLSEWLEQARVHLDEFRRSWSSVLLATALAFVIQGVYILVWIVLARFVGFELPLASFLVTVPVVSLGAMIPVTLSGVGVREGLWILLLSRFELAPASVAAFSLLYFAAFVLTGLIGGALYLLRGLSP